MRAINVRPYQKRIIEQAGDLIGRGDHSVLIEMATGTGKTRVAAEIAKWLPFGRILWVAHRIELVQQAANALIDAMGGVVGMIGAGSMSFGDRADVASRDTLAPMLERYPERWAEYGTLIIDEAHHVPTKRYEQIIAAMPNAWRIGLTATPDRMDKRRVRKWFTAATDPYDLPTAIRDAWLVPFLARRVRVGAVDLSAVRAVSGDFVQEELNAVMSAHAAIDGMAQGIRKFQGDRPTLAYCSSVGAAESMAEALDARCVTGSTPAEERSTLIADFGKAYQTLVSVGVLNEGVDLPSAACVALCSATKSRSKYTQWIGRAARPLPGLSEAVEADVRSERSDWICLSDKPNALVLDFVGVCGKHSVITPADVLGGSPAARARVKRQIEAGVRTISVAEAIELEDTRLTRRRMALEEKDREWALRHGVELPPADIQARDIGIVGLTAGDRREEPQVTPIQPSQAKRLYLMGGAVSPDMTSGEAAAAIRELDAGRTARGLATLKQLELLARYGRNSPGLEKGAATGLIMQIKRNGWMAPKGRIQNATI